VAAQAARGREAFAHQSWAEAHEILAGCRSLDADDLERLAVAAHLIGRERECAQAWERAHRAHLRLGDPERAARCAFWLAVGLFLRGEMAPGEGWMARAERLLDDVTGDCSVRGLLLVPAFLGALEGGDAPTAATLADEMVAVGQRCGDVDLLALGLLSQGQAILLTGDARRGMRRLDEAMVSVVAGEVSPIASGIVYCAVIESGMAVCDLRRAAEWTAALTDWCASQPDLVPFRGQCLVHRSQVLQAHGSWADAVEEAERARQRLSEPTHPALGLALYQQGELHRLQGELAEADRAFRSASEHGCEPEPGFALLRLAEGTATAAGAAVRRMLDEGVGRLERPVRLAAAVAVLLAIGDVDGATAAAQELDALAATTEAVLLRAMADHANGAVALAGGDPAAALAPLRRAGERWRELGVPYEAARTRVVLAQALRVLGDGDAAALELDAARTTFARLGAVLDVAHVDELAAPAPPRPPDGLTGRECEVLRLVAAGRTNREIAAALVISEHTVARHLQNIFVKLGLSSRAAATAYAYEHGLVGTA
jgi:ATP/maltotriose-dependent transcriptional regulator MalT